MDSEQSELDVKKTLETFRESELISFEQLQTFDEFISNCLMTLCRFSNPSTALLIFKKDELISTYFYTEQNEYIIKSKKPKDENLGYIGCQVTSRKNRVGETWLRGRELPEGSYKTETWADILTAIVSYEVKEIECFKKE